MKTRDYDLLAFRFLSEDNIFKSLNGFHLWFAISQPVIFANNEDPDKSIVVLEQELHPTKYNKVK